MPELNLSCFEDQPVLKTERLTLRPFEKQDIEEIFEMRASSRVSSFIYRPLLQDISEAQDIMDYVAKGMENKETIGWAALLRDKPKPIGTVGIIRINHQHFHAEIGGEMRTKYWGNGLAHEAVEAVINYGFGVMNLHAFEGWIAPENRGAVRILEDFNFEKQAYFKDKAWRDGWHDMAVYTLYNEKFKV